jgi:UDP-N-acetylglucosamine--N-acetylmuramyl-(pentapeptide) pyrophosphoryl-undecaprenol N-acetylglucosamine transferase
MRVVIAGGGTGGHLYPVLALSEELSKRDPTIEILFMGTEKGIEAKVVPREGYTIEFIPGEGFMGKSFLKKIRSLFRLVKGLKESYRYLNSIQPDVVIGSGGYASFAPVFSAWLLSIPTMILEQNTVPGKTNRFLGRIVRSVCVTYQDSMAYFPRGKVHLSGNPVRESLLKGSRPAALKLFSMRDDLFTILIFGGSSGARSINAAVAESLRYFLDLKKQLQFLHQTGEKDFDFARDAYRSFGFMGTVSPFIYQMPEAYAISDLVISRSGATTLAEICAMGKASILIPYPYATANHQEINAKKLENLGACTVIRDAELTGKKLAEEVKRLFHDSNLRNAMGKKALGFGRPDAVKRIADIVISLVSFNGKNRVEKTIANHQTEKEKNNDRNSQRAILNSKQ